ncbi:hypothetical protein HJC23_009905 [Cyclotella cryptica]|uniref:Protein DETOXIFICATION n=1 Tax=Cyclotella cryptica TaxID=29204 RepID=A0ABD3QDF5_9STRA|eukprot:CCRYP_007024-RC/>CCRYP_007024-RC protein AED:0.11 eAED:0.11 QI:0/-1/0/1/-1/1/1/0/586
MKAVILLVSALAADAFSLPYCLNSHDAKAVLSFPWKVPTSCVKPRFYNSGKFPTTLRSPLRLASPNKDNQPRDSDYRIDNSQNLRQPTPFVGLPPYSRIIIFVATTVLIWISEPLLSLVDSAAVGRYARKDAVSKSMANGPNLSSVVQLAALGPATMLCDSSMYLTFFIAMATTNKLANSFAKYDLEEQITTVSHVMAISLTVGIILFLGINFLGEGLLSSILGPVGATITIQTARGGAETIDLTRQVLNAALGYARIRSAVYPLSVMGLTSQAALLCAGDTKTPTLAVLVASLTNIIGDYFFVAKLGFGVRGAALATSLASMMSNGILVSNLWRAVQGWKHNLENSSNDKHTSVSRLPFVSFPDRKSFVSLVQLAGPMFFVLVGKVMGYSAMTMRAGTFGLVSLACHNILMRLFFFFATMGDGLSHAAQTFMPGLLYQKSLVEKEGAAVAQANDGKKARTLLKRLLVLSASVGASNSVLSRFIASNFGVAVTTDSSLVSLMSEVSPFMGLALLIHPITMTLEGSIIAGRNLTYLVGTYMASFLILLAQLNLVCTQFIGVWHALLLFQMIRILQFGSLVWKQTSSL